MAEGIDVSKWNGSLDDLHRRVFTDGIWQADYSIVRNIPKTPKLYPHKFFVQFHRNIFTVYSNETITEFVENSPGKMIQHNKQLCSRMLTFCTIHPIDTADFYYGQAVLNPKDKDNIVRGCKEAFNHAVWDLWQTEMKWEDFAKIFFDALLKKNLTNENILNGFVLKVRLPWEAKKHGH